MRTKRGDLEYFERVRTALAGVPGVHRVQVNPQTGSVLLEYGADESAVLATAKDEGLFTVAAADRALARHSEAQPGPRVAAPVSPLNLAASGLAGAGLLQLARGRVLGSASENLWNAYGFYALTRQALPSAVLIAFGLFQAVRGEVLGSATSLFVYAYLARRRAQDQAAEGTP
ncbi:MAG: heavy-metal-associated domain-containing protein [Acetobacteraceae bacterium]|nr:heavy-metal-associated domain-containing protein [Acetobacteraceae bacterium]